MEIAFPIEFTVRGRPVSSQSRNARSRAAWQERVKAASVSAIPRPHFVSDNRIAITLYYLPEQPVRGDVDNIVKLVLDAMSKHIYLDDAQVERVVVQKFEPGNVFRFSNPTPAMVGAIAGPKPALYVRVSNDPFEDLR